MPMEVWVTHTLPSSFLNRQQLFEYDYAGLTRSCAGYHIRNRHLKHCSLCRHWNTTMAITTKLYKSMSRKYASNIAFASMYAFQLYQDKKYAESLPLLEQAYNLWRFPLIQIVAASVKQYLGLSANAIYEELWQVKNYDWSFITNCYPLSLPRLFLMNYTLSMKHTYNTVQNRWKHLCS